MSAQQPSGNPQARIIILVAVILFISIVPFVFLGRGGMASTIFSILSIAIIPGLILLGVGIYQFMRTYYVAKPEISFTPSGVKLGETVTMNFQQRFKKRTTVKRLSFKLVFRETAKYQVGTDTRTVTHEIVVDEFGYAGQEYPRGHILTDSWQFQIPVDGMHNFSANRNWLQWYVKVSVEIEGWMNFNEEYKVSVVPERALATTF